MKTLFVIAAVIVTNLSISIAQPAEWEIDKAHSKIMFSVPHMVVSEANGDFKKFDGTITIDGDNLETAVIDFTIDVNSINTDNEMRDNHLKSDDFFNAEKYPQIKFKAKKIKKGSGNTYIMSGYLTIRDVTKPVDFTVTYGGMVKDAKGKTHAGYKISGSINRFDYGVKFSKTIESGGLVVGDVVSIIANMEIIK